MIIILCEMQDIIMHFAVQKTFFRKFLYDNGTGAGDTYNITMMKMMSGCYHIEIVEKIIYSCSFKGGKFHSIEYMMYLEMRRMKRGGRVIANEFCNKSNCRKLHETFVRR